MLKVGEQMIFIDGTKLTATEHGVIMESMTDVTGELSMLKDFFIKRNEEGNYEFSHCPAGCLAAWEENEIV